MTNRPYARWAVISLSTLAFALAIPGAVRALSLAVPRPAVSSAPAIALAAHKKHAMASKETQCQREFKWCVKNCRSPKHQGSSKSDCIDVCAADKWWCDAFGPGA